VARKLGYGGLANTRGTRSFAGKTEAEALIRVLGIPALPEIPTFGGIYR